jgi:hypothetical protein
MDTARVVHHDTGPPRGPRRRRRWILAVALAGLAAPLTSGSAIALTGGTSGATSAAATPAAFPASQLRHYATGEKSGTRHGRRCNRDKSGASMRGTSSPEL